MTVYLKLLHGRDDPAQDMKDWGYDGPTLGPFEAIHAVYTSCLRCFPVGSDGDTDAIEINYTEDMLVHEGKFYGDFEIAARFGDKTLPHDPEGMNESRSAWAAAALAQFQQVTGADDCDAVCDLLGDLMHWCDRHGQDFSHQLQRGRDHYAAETAPVG